MKIFIWNSPYSVPYGSSFLFVAAETEEEARKMARFVPITEFGLNPDADSGTLGLEPDGQADRIIELPGGECYQWSE